MSKMRYGLQLMNNVRLTDENRKLKNIKATQIAPKNVTRLPMEAELRTEEAKRMCLKSSTYSLSNSHQLRFNCKKPGK